MAFAANARGEPFSRASRAENGKAASGASKSRRERRFQVVSSCTFMLCLTMLRATLYRKYNTRILLPVQIVLNWPYHACPYGSPTARRAGPAPPMDDLQ